jgi:hypothetical protein
MDKHTSLPNDATYSIFYLKYILEILELHFPPGVNVTNVLRAAFAPKAFCHKITNPNCKLIKAEQRALV